MAAFSAGQSFASGGAPGQGFSGGAPGQGFSGGAPGGPAQGFGASDPYGAASQTSFDPYSAPGYYAPPPAPVWNFDGYGTNNSGGGGNTPASDFQSSPSPALTDPYAPGGAFAPGSSGANVKAGPGGGPRPGSATSLPSHRNGNSFQKGAPLVEHALVPKWFKWTAGFVLFVMLVAFASRWLRARNKQKGAPSMPRSPSETTGTCPPTPACPPIPACPPTGPCPPIPACPPTQACPQIPEEITLRVAKGSPPLMVKLEGGAHDERRKKAEEMPWRREDATRPPIVILNESMPRERHSQLPSDLWDMTYSSDGTSVGARTGDTNMVFNRVGAFS